MCYNNSYLFLSFHNKLKTNPHCINHRVNQWCDNLIEVPLTIEEDMFFERMRKKVMLSPKDASLKAEGEQRHAHGKHYTFNTIAIGINCSIKKIQIQVESSNVYKVASSTGSKSYNVTINPNRCIQRQCIPQCNESESGYLCRHTAQCTCADYIHGHLCKDTHKVHKSHLVRFINPY